MVKRIEISAPDTTLAVWEATDATVNHGVVVMKAAVPKIYISADGSSDLGMAESRPIDTYVWPLPGSIVRIRDTRPSGQTSFQATGEYPVLRQAGR